MGKLSDDEVDRMIDDITMSIEELSSMSGGILYADIIKKIENRLCIDRNGGKIKKLKELRDRYDTNDFAIRGIIEKTIDIVSE